MTRFAVAVVAVLLVAGCFCRPQDAKAKNDGRPEESRPSPPTPTNRASRLQKPTQVLNSGFDEIVVESNLQVHNRVASKPKSKIILPSATNATAAAFSNKSARSLVM